MMAKGGNPSLEDEIQRHRDAIDDYESSVQGLYALASSVCWDDAKRRLRPQRKISIPRTMTRQDGEGNRNFTPDCVIQPAPNYGVIAEMKKHHRDGGDVQAFVQIKNYDNDLLGWWTNSRRIDKHDLVLLTHVASCTRARDAYKLWKNQGNCFDRPFAIVEFTHARMGQSHFLLRRTEGSLSDSVHDEALRQGKLIPDRVFVDVTSKYKFYDAKPPLMHMLRLLQEGALPQLFSEEEYDVDTDRVHPRIETSVEEVRGKLQELYCDPIDPQRQPKLPKADWVREALDTFKAIGLARALIGDGRDRYEVVLREPTHKDVIEYFTRKLRAARKQRATAAVGSPDTSQQLEIGFSIDNQN